MRPFGTPVTSIAGHLQGCFSEYQEQIDILRRDKENWMINYLAAMAEIDKLKEEIVSLKSVIEDK